jgi:hypothetical protein
VGTEGWGVMVVVCFWGWVGAVAGLILTTFPLQGSFRTRTATIWGVGVIVFYALWIVSMLTA